MTMTKYARAKARKKMREMVKLPPMHVTKEARLIAALARRHTPEWYDDGRQLLIDRAAAADAANERKRRDEADAWEAETFSLREPALRKLDRHLAAFQESIDGYEDDPDLPAILMDLIDNYANSELLNEKGKLTKVATVIYLELLRCFLGLTVRQGLDYIKNGESK